MAKLDDQISASRKKAEELLTRKQNENERVANRERDSRAQDEKTARLRQLRLAKEAAEKDLPKPATRKVGKKAVNTV
jgi:hypothetical protein